jgi:hypothetical protein
MAINIPNNPNTLNPSSNTDATTKTHKHGHHKKIDTQDNNTTQKPDAVSSATKKGGGDHYFETKA